MGENAKPKSNMHAVILLLLGAILMIAGLYIITVPGAPMRGSGIGTISLVLGVVVLLISFLRFFYKKP
jgi:membrane-bound ClpP family serine protease